MEKGRSLYGVLDEEGVLEHGQVLVQYTSKSDNEGDEDILYHVVGQVIVTKTPCLHPGDLLVLQVSKAAYADATSP